MQDNDFDSHGAPQSFAWSTKEEGENRAPGGDFSPLRMERRANESRGTIGSALVCVVGRTTAGGGFPLLRA